MSGTGLPEGAGTGEESIRNPVTWGYLNPIRYPAALLTKSLSLRNRGPVPRCGPDGSDSDPTLLGLGGRHHPHHSSRHGEGDGGQQSAGHRKNLHGELTTRRLSKTSIFHQFCQGLKVKKDR